MGIKLAQQLELMAIIKKIITVTGKEEREILNRIKQKQEDLGGCITEEGSACIVAKELGVDIFGLELLEEERKLVKSILGEDIKYFKIQKEENRIIIKFKELVDRDIFLRLKEKWKNRGGKIQKLDDKFWLWYIDLFPLTKK